MIKIKINELFSLEQLGLLEKMEKTHMILQ
nr:MAG TPA: hypothetical protein [Crassvirales sp.]